MRQIEFDTELQDKPFLAGLEKPSVARLNRLVTAEKWLLTKYLGRLASSDAAAVKAAWNQNMMLQAPNRSNEFGAMMQYYAIAAHFPIAGADPGGFELIRFAV